jgi:prepilin-type N-terminal cleavage/methylation domain-containing protein
VRDERGFSLLELLIVVVIISVLMVVAIDKLLKLRYEAERVMVQSVVAALRSALYVEFSASTARGERNRLDSLRGSNPMLRLSEKPDGYAGEFYGPDSAVFEPGTWYFDTRDHALVYVLRFQNSSSAP